MLDWVVGLGKAGNSGVWSSSQSNDAIRYWGVWGCMEQFIAMVKLSGIGVHVFHTEQHKILRVLQVATQKSIGRIYTFIEFHWRESTPSFCRPSSLPVLRQTQSLLHIVSMRITLLSQATPELHPAI